MPPPKMKSLNWAQTGDDSYAPSSRHNQNHDEYENYAKRYPVEYAVGDTLQAMREVQPSSAERFGQRDRHSTIPGKDLLDEAPNLDRIRDKTTMRDIGAAATKAATEGDKSVGRKPPSYKHGGHVPRTGLALLHEGETVIPKDATTEKIRDILGGHGAELRPHEVHIRHTAEKGKYIAKHILRDKQGNSPSDGQRGEAEFALGSPEEMLAHLHQHMVAEPDQDDEEA